MKDQTDIWLQDALDTKKVMPIPEKYVKFSCPIFVLKQGDKYRTIWNGILLNHYIPKFKFRLPKADDVFKLILGKSKLSLDYQSDTVLTI